MCYNDLVEENINFMVCGSERGSLEETAFNAGFGTCTGLQEPEVAQLSESKHQTKNINE